MNYYNEHDQFAAAWLRNLIAEGLIPDGDVDDRDIRDVCADDLAGFVQHHFFAGLGGWPYALRLAGWPDSRPIVTGSCPCQPFSSAGRRLGTDDERHLWPAFRWLIAQLRPAIVAGEQVASADGREWLAGVRSDLEAMGYAVGAADLPAACVAAPHKRQRLFWLANAVYHDRSSWTSRSQQQSVAPVGEGTGGDCQSGRLADAANTDGRRGERPPQAGTRQNKQRRRGPASGGVDSVGGFAKCRAFIGCTRPATRIVRHGEYQYRGPDLPICDACFAYRESQRLGDLLQPGLEGHAWHVDGGDESGRLDTHPGGPVGQTSECCFACGYQFDHDALGMYGCPNCFGEGLHDEESQEHWSDYEIVLCDERAFGRGIVARRTQPGLFPLVDGAAFRLADGRSRNDTSRAKLLRGIGNAIVPQVAAMFIQGFMECRLSS